MHPISRFGIEVSKKQLAALHTADIFAKPA